VQLIGTCSSGVFFLEQAFMSVAVSISVSIVSIMTMNSIETKMTVIN